MRWKFCLPPGGSDNDRTALEDLYLVPEDGSSAGRSYWITVEGLQSFTGGTREEKLERLAGKEFHISDTMDMLVRREDFDRVELLAWAKVFIQNRFGDSQPELIPADGDEVTRCTPVIREPGPRERTPRPARYLFVHRRSLLQLAPPELTLTAAPGTEIRTAVVDEGTSTEVPGEDCRWADLVFVMDKRMRQALHRRFKALGLPTRIVCLYLPEHHDPDDQAFLAMFRERVGMYLDRLGWDSVSRE